MIRILLLFVFAGALSAQVYSPKLLREGQPDASDLRKFAQAIYVRAGANTPRAKAEAIWRFFLTDGRFVKPGFWYHIAGWTYEEPSGEVLDPIKLLNSYGFGLCYHIAPLLEAVFEAGGFADARCWFLTGHTVAEVFYDGGYHYFDSDMMGYNVAGEGSFKGKPVVSVHDLEGNSNIFLGKLVAPDKVKPGVVDQPWYPADVQARAMNDLVKLFTTTADNHLYPYTRYATGHAMDFVLRPGEKLIRFFAPEEPGLFYLPYKFDGKTWTEFPQEFSEFQIRTADGPRSQKDGRLWATGRIEYSPPKVPNDPVTVVDMPSPYVVIDARFTLALQSTSAGSAVKVETSTDGGRTWMLGGQMQGRHQGTWSVEPAVLVRSAHGKLTAVSGSYGYKVRITKAGSPQPVIQAMRLVSRIQLNPRALPEVRAGSNTFEYSASAPSQRTAFPVPLANSNMRGFDLVRSDGQDFLLPRPGKTGEVIYTISADGCPLTGFDAGARILDLRNDLVPDKLTAEVRHSGRTSVPGTVTFAWSISPHGPFYEFWNYDGRLTWRDGKAVDRLLLWPEAFQRVRDLPARTKQIFVRVRSSGPGFDSLRLAAYSAGAPAAGSLSLSQIWEERGVRKEHVERFEAADRDRRFSFRAGTQVKNIALVFSAEPSL